MACNKNSGRSRARRSGSVAAAALTLAALLALAFPAATGAAAGRGPIRVTTTLSVLRALVEAVGGEKVRVEAIASPQFDPHFIEPKPSDIVKLGRSDFFVHMGLDLELWRGPLVEAAVNPRLLPGGEGEIDAEVGIQLLEVPTRALSRAEGDIHLYGNPHYWLDPANAAIMAGRIADRLSTADGVDEAFFRGRAEALRDELQRRTREWKATLAPYRGERLVAYHNSWPYFAQVFGLRIDLFLEPKPGIPPSGAHLERLLAGMKKDAVKVIIIERYQSRRTAEDLARQAGAQVVELWQNPDPKSGYADMMDRNVKALAAALGGAPVAHP